MACGGWEGGVDPGQLEARLRAGIEADRRYAAENSAKLRAIHSAPTYDEFRQLVLGEFWRGTKNHSSLHTVLESL